MDSENDTLHKKLEMVMKGVGAHADIVRMIAKDFPEKFKKIISNSYSLRFLVNQEHVIRFLPVIMGGKETDAADIDTLGEFVDLLLDPQFIASIDNILILRSQQKQYLVTKLGDIVRHEGVDCLTDETLPIAFYSVKACYLWICLGNEERQTLYECYKSGRVISTCDAGFVNNEKKWHDFISTWDEKRETDVKPFSDGIGINFADPEHRKIINDNFHDNFSSRED